MAYRDPYTVLGVDRNATDEEIKKAYHDLCRKYHPDRYKDPELAEVANQKMTEINAAYDDIQKMRASGQTQGGYQGYGPGSGYSGDYYDNHSSDSLHAEAYEAVRRYINSSEITNAYAVLMSIPEEDRGAEWNFLFGCVLVRRGNIYDAARCFDTACRLDPDNREYANARDQLRMRRDGTSRTYVSDDTCNTGCGNDCCCKILCCLRCCC